MDANRQGDYALRRTGNYFDQIEGTGYHLQPLTFHEFLQKPESNFMYDTTFFQIPGYIQQTAQIAPIEEEARQYVVNYIMEEFAHNLLGMQDYVRWARIFEHRCAGITPSFWAQVNMHDLMMARDLEMDDNTVTRTNTGNATRLGTQTTTAEQSGESETAGKTTTKQSVTNAQTTDASTREANATVVRAADELTSEIRYDWSDAADNVHEVRSRAGDTEQHMDSETNSESKTLSSSHSVTTSRMDNNAEESTATSRDVMSMTNKMYMQEKQWAIQTARDLFPLEWLRSALRPLFYMIY